MKVFCFYGVNCAQQPNVHHQDDKFDPTNDSVGAGFGKDQAGRAAAVASRLRAKLNKGHDEELSGLDAKSNGTLLIDEQGCATCTASETRIDKKKKRKTGRRARKSSICTDDGEVFVN